MYEIASWLIYLRIVEKFILRRDKVELVAGRISRDIYSGVYLLDLILKYS